jgi:preprotein translocase subunit SecF
MARLLILATVITAVFWVLFWLATWTNYFGGDTLRRWFKNMAIGLGAITASSIGIAILHTFDLIS